MINDSIKSCPILTRFLTLFSFPPLQISFGNYLPLYFMEETSLNHSFKDLSLHVIRIGK